MHPLHLQLLLRLLQLFLYPGDLGQSRPAAAALPSSSLRRSVGSLASCIDDKHSLHPHRRPSFSRRDYIAASFSFHFDTHPPTRVRHRQHLTRAAPPPHALIPSASRASAAFQPWLRPATPRRRRHPRPRNGPIPSTSRPPPPRKRRASQRASRCCFASTRT